MPHSTQSRSAQTALEERVNAHDREIAGIRRDIHAIGEKMDTLVHAIGSMRSPNWQAIWGAAGVSVAIITLFGTVSWYPLSKSLSKLEEAELYRYRTEMTTFVPRVEIDVMRDSYDKELSHLKESLIDLTKRFGETYTVRDALDDMTKRIDRLQDIVSAPALNRRDGVLGLE